MIDSLCVKCEKQLSKSKIQQQKVQSQHPKISLGFLYHLALKLQFSFQSIALLVDFAMQRQAKDLQIRMLKTNDLEAIEMTQQSYDECLVEIKFNGKCLTKEEIEYFANAYYSKLKNSMQLVLSMFGIGKTGILINNNGKEKSVVLFSVDDRINSNYYKDEVALYFIEDIETKTIKSLNGASMKKIITQGLRIYHPRPDKILQCPQNKMKVIILHPKIFVTNTKIMVYEIRESNLGYDIDTHYNPEKVEFLNKLGYQMSIHSQFRLSCYFSCLYLNNSLSIRIGESQQPICKTTYSEYLKTLLQNGALVKIKEVKISGVSKMQLYETTQKYVMQNNGILMYWKGRMINRFDTQFGRMLQQKFYKKKYRSPPQNIWPILGIIQVDSTKIIPNLLKNKFRNNFDYRRLVRDLQIMLQNMEKKHNAIAIDNDDGNEERQVRNISTQIYSNTRKRVKKSKEEDFEIE